MPEITLETSGEDVKIHSKWVWKMIKYTRNEWGTCSSTLETGGEKDKIHSKRAEKITVGKSGGGVLVHDTKAMNTRIYTRNGLRRLKNTLQTSVKNRTRNLTSVQHSFSLFISIVRGYGYDRVLDRPVGEFLCYVFQFCKQHCSHLFFYTRNEWRR